MRKSKKNSDTTSGDDDVAGLFRRLGADGDAVYRDFGGERLRPSPPPLPVAPPAPQPAPPAAPAPAVTRPVAPVPETAPAPAPAPAQAPARPAAPARNGAPAAHVVTAAAPTGATGRTPLQQLFDRLAGEGDSPGRESPLRRLRGA